MTGSGQKKPGMQRKRGTRLPAVSEQMKAWSAAIAGEVADWPQVTTRSFFGFTALYRGDRMFAALPRTRAMETATSLAFKIESPAQRVKALLARDPRIGAMQMQEARWFTFEMSNDADLRGALEWLDRAYSSTAKNKKSS